MDNSLRGKVCASSNGDLGIPFVRREWNGVWFWEGVSLDGSLWRSRSPEVVANSVADYMNFIPPARPIPPPPVDEITIEAKDISCG